jgi:hypothetical protein
MRFEDTIKAKSDQLNAVDIIDNTVLKITGVKIIAGDQPVSIFYEGDNGKPYKPCLSMRRVIAEAWGTDEANFAGKSLQVYNDKDVIWAGEAVGGVRIKAMSHIDKKGIEVIIALNRKKRIKIKIECLNIEPSFYPDDKFQKALPAIKKALDGGMTYEQITEQCKKTGMLTSEQENIIYGYTQRDKNEV